MIIVGELINTSRKDIELAVENMDTQLIQNIAQKQVEAGATYVDVNAGTQLAKEPETLEWLVKTVQSAVNVPLCIDSPNAVALDVALRAHSGKAMINSITAEEDRYRTVLPLIKKYGCSVVALCMDDSGMPASVADRIRIAGQLVKNLTAEGVPAGDIYLDPLVFPIGTGSGNCLMVLETIQEVNRCFAGVHTICGLSNVSYGLPLRKLLNRVFLVLCMGAGMDSVILNPMDKRIMSLVHAAKALMDQDEYCISYITAFREGKLDA